VIGPDEAAQVVHNPRVEDVGSFGRNGHWNPWRRYATSPTLQRRLPAAIIARPERYPRRHSGFARISGG
jgi:hypothetical protein